MIFYVAAATLVVAVGVIVIRTRQSRRQKSGPQNLAEEPAEPVALPAQAAVEPLPVTAESVQLGIRAFMKGRYREAFELLEPAAHQGNLRAQQLLAKMYYAGNGVPADREKYLYWLARAGANGDKPSKIKLKKARAEEIAAHSKSVDS